MQIVIDTEFKQLIPPLTADEYKGLEDSILADGCRDALVLWGDVLVDGHNRYEICTRHGIPFDTVEMDFPTREAASVWIIKNQFGRRNLPAYERGRLALKIKPLIAAMAKEKQREAGGAVRQISDKAAIDTKKELAAIAGVSHDTIAKVEKMELKIVYLSPDELTPYENNTRKHSPYDIDGIKESIRRVGFRDPIGIWGKDNLIVEGHGRQIAALEMGLDKVPCIRLDDMTENQRKEYAIRHNRSAEMSEWDFSKLEEEIARLEIEGVDLSGMEFDFAADNGSDFFSRENRNDTGRQEANDEYNEFLDKFETKKTTDDCYTPEIVYDAIAEWVSHEYGINRPHFVRPFYPGGDYKNYSYPADCAVVDNPPFSILAEIISWYAERNIRFFLFAPQLTLFSSSSSSCCLPCGVDITYENGAVVPTSFVTNLEDNRVRVIPELYKVVEAANDKNREATRRTLPKYKYPDYVLTAAMCNYMCAHDTPLTIKRKDSQHIRYLDSQKEYGDKTIFGSGYLLSEKAAAEKAAAEKAAAEKAAAHVWELSEREWKIIRRLGGDTH